MYRCFCFFKQKTAYEMRISDWSSDVCSSDLSTHPARAPRALAASEEFALVRQHPRFRRYRREARAQAARDQGRQGPRHAGRARRADSSAYRSEESRGGKECVSTCRSRGSLFQYKHTTYQKKHTQRTIL